MATINFLYRSIKPKAKLNVRLLYRINDTKYKNGYKDFTIGGRTQISISKEDWEDIQIKRKVNSDPYLNNLKIEVQKQKNDLRFYILDRFNEINESEVSKEWFKKTIDLYYNPEEEEEEPEVPTTLIKLIEYYLDNNKYNLLEGRKRRISVVKNKFIRFENYLGYTIKVSKVNDNLKNRFIEFSDTYNYATNTQKSDISIIKTICTYASKKGIEVSQELADLSIKGEPVENIYLNFQEIKVISKLELENEYLDNARDWLLISCYTGQRISDFMRFNSDMIVSENNRHFLEFRQKKTKKLMRIPFTKEARAIVAKRNGEFPRAISHQKYNDYIKEVCKLAGINELTDGKLLEFVGKDIKKAERHDYRKVTAKVEKYKLASSHIGRRSFATNNYGKIATTYLRYITGHSSEKQFLAYIKKSNEDLASDAYDHFANDAYDYFD